MIFKEFLFLHHVWWTPRKYTKAEILRCLVHPVTIHIACSTTIHQRSRLFCLFCAIVGEPVPGVQSYDFIPIMQREGPQASASGAQASGQGNCTMQEVLQDFIISEFSETQLDALPLAPQAAAPTLPLAPQAAAPTLPLAPQSMAPIPPSVPWAAAPIPPLASQAMAPPSAFQAAVPPPALQALATGPVVSSMTFSPPIVNTDGTISRKMDQEGNNVTVTFSGNYEIASKKCKLIGSSAKLDTFRGQDMSQFLKGVAQFLSEVNLFQPTGPSACKVALHLLMGKAAKI